MLFWLTVSPDLMLRFVAFFLFVLAGLSDVWDGYLARRHGQITDMGKLLDPLADKLLLAVTLIPVFLISHRGGPLDEVPWWGPLPMWVLIVIFVREIFMTLFRSYAVRQGVVIPAGWSGKRKAMFQMFFIGGVLFWYPLAEAGRDAGWTGGLWTAFSTVVQAWVGIMLPIAVLLTVYSLIDYLWSYRTVVGIRD